MPSEHQADLLNSEYSDGISKLSLSGFKSFANETSIEIRPLTILSGANSSGKSSAVQPLLLLKQTLETNYDPGTLLINGPNVQFTSAEDQLLAIHSDGGRASEVRIGLEIDEETELIETFANVSRRGLELRSMSYKNLEEKYDLRPGMNSEQIEEVIPQSAKDHADAFTNIIRERRDEIPTIRWKVRQHKCFLSYDMQIIEDDKTIFNLASPEGELSAPFERYIQDIIHVPGLRGNPERTYKTASSGPQFPGTFNNYVASVINFWKENQPDLLTELERNLQRLGLTSAVTAKQLDDVQVELLVGRLPYGTVEETDLVSIADVGFGVSQTLPVLVSLLVAKPGQMVYLEQPEIHLHPRAQFELAALLVEASNRGVRVVLETHSDLLLLGLQTEIAEGNLPHELAMLHWFSRVEDSGRTQVVSHELDNTGAFGDWPEDFSQIKLQAENRYLDAIESH